MRPQSAGSPTPFLRTFATAPRKHRVFDPGASVLGRRAMHFHDFAARSILFIASILLLAMPARAAEPLTLAARLAYPVMKSGEGQQNYLRIGLNGCEPQHKADRTPVNVAFVIDRSGSMGGARIAQAREAAIMAIKRLNDDDIASVVIFDDRVEVPVPAQKVADQGYFI